jgi:hypothetical protein
MAWLPLKLNPLLRNDLAGIPKTYSSFSNSEIPWPSSCGIFLDTIALQQ